MKEISCLLKNLEGNAAVAGATFQGFNILNNG